MKPIAIFLGVLSAAAVVFAQAAGPIRQEQVLIANDQLRFAPGYAVGDIAVVDPKVADFRVLTGRRELLLYGKQPGSTSMTIWDQQHTARHELTIVVVTRAAYQAEQDLRTQLSAYGFPGVAVSRFAGGVSVTGSTDSRSAFDSIDRLASAAGAKNLVRYTGPDTAPASAASAPAPVRKPPVVEYEIELFEASSQYRSGSYATGVEPSGRSLFKGRVQAPFGDIGEILIGGNDVKTKEIAKNAPPPSQETGLRLKMRPSDPGPDGRFITYVLIQTNLPIGGETYDPKTWRLARWQFAAGSGEPFGITGADLLASPESDPSGAGGPGFGSRATSTAVQQGGSRIPVLRYVPVFGSLFGSKNYKDKKTQLLLVVRPRVVAPQ
jgi:hypothetical protein